MLPADVDLVITATISPDRIMPATASRVARECGCDSAGVFDLSAGCTGFVYALAMATGAVASGLHKHVLVVGAETISVCSIGRIGQQLSFRRWCRSSSGFSAGFPGWFRGCGPRGILVSTWAQMARGKNSL